MGDYSDWGGTRDEHTVGLDVRSGVQGTGGQTVNGEPLRLRWSKGCLWIDLDERAVASQRSHVASQTVTAGGFRTISEVQNIAKRRLRRTECDISQPFLGMKSGHNSEKSSDLGHSILTSWR